VPKREIFDRCDFVFFYTIKPFWVGDFGAKIKITFLNIYGFISWAQNVYAQPNFKDTFLRTGPKVLCVSSF
jgi:hypothetical protein